MMYRNIAERLVAGYPFDWSEHSRMRETCVCGVEIVCSTLVNVIITFILLCCLSKEEACLIFFIVNGTVRIFSGGIHAKDHLNCFLTYIGILLCSAYAASYLDEIKFCLYILCIIVPVITMTINFKYGGMQSHLEIMERKKFNFYCKGFVTIYNAVLITLCMIEILSKTNLGAALRNGLYVMCFALLTQSISLFLGRKTCINYKDKRC